MHFGWSARAGVVSRRSSAAIALIVLDAFRFDESSVIAEPSLKTDSTFVKPKIETQVRESH